MRRIAHIGMVVWLVAALFSSVCLACAPSNTASCCHRAGHCKKAMQACDPGPSAVIAAAAPVIDLPSAAIEPAVPPAIETRTAVVTLAEDFPPDLCLLHSVFRI